MIRFGQSYLAGDACPGHYVPGADTNHILGFCPECDAHYMAGMGWDRAHEWYRLGVFSQDQWEAFDYVWATSAYRYSARDYYAPPEDPAVAHLADMMKDILAARKAVQA